MNSKSKSRFFRHSLVLSLLGFVLMVGAIWSNDFYLSSVRPQYVISDNSRNIDKLNRAIANVQPSEVLGDAVMRDQKTAEKLKNLERQPTAVSAGVSEVDQLRFGLLKGKYSLRLNEKGQISAIEYADNGMAGEMPENIKPEAFLSQYKKTFSVSYSDFKPAQELTGREKSKEKKYELLSEQGQSLGSAIFEMNDEGRFVRARISSN